MAERTNIQSLAERLRKEPFFRVVNDIGNKAGTSLDTHIHALLKEASSNGIPKAMKRELQKALGAMANARRHAGQPAMEMLAKAILHMAPGLPLLYSDTTARGGTNTGNPPHGRRKKLGHFDGNGRRGGDGTDPQGGKTGKRGPRGATKAFVENFVRDQPKGKGGELKAAAVKAGINPNSASVQFYKRRSASRKKSYR